MPYKNFLPTTLSKAYEQSKVGAGVEKEIAENFLITTIKGIGCNWMGCIAVFLCGQAQNMAGKMVGIWFPIPAFVAIGFEHIPANMFMMPLGLLAGTDVSVLEMLYKKT